MKPKNLYGYTRVSSHAQELNYSLENQKDILINFGVPENHIIAEVGSAGENKSQPLLHEQINNLPEGSILVVTRLDRFSRSTLSALKRVETLNKKGILFRSLDLPMSPDESTNRLIFQVLVSLAQFETNRRKVRQQKGIQKAKLHNKYLGRKPKFTSAKEIKRLENYFKQGISLANVARIEKTCRGTIYHALKTNQKLLAIREANRTDRIKITKKNDHKN